MIFYVTQCSRSGNLACNNDKFYITQLRFESAFTMHVYYKIFASCNLRIIKFSMINDEKTLISIHEMKQLETFTILMEILNFGFSRKSCFSKNSAS